MDGVFVSAAELETVSRSGRDGTAKTPSPDKATATLLPRDSSTHEDTKVNGSIGNGVSTVWILNISKHDE